MIVDAILNILFLPIKMLLALIPDMSNMPTIPNGLFDGVNMLFCNLGYIFPVRQLMPIFAISLFTHVFRLGWAVVLRIKSFIPTMGD